MSRLRSIIKNKQMFAGLVLLFVIAAFVSYAGLVNHAKLIDTINFSTRGLLPSSSHVFGTDAYGRDLFPIIAIAIQNDLFVGLTATIISGSIGILIGSLAVMLGGWKDEGVMRTAEIFMSVPPLIFALAIVAALGKSFTFLIIALTLASWPVLSRIVRSRILTEVKKPYVEMLQVLGIRKSRVMFRHVLPNVSFFLASLIAIHAATIISIFSTLEYIGFGSGSLTPELGAIITQGQPFVFSDVWIEVIPAAFLVIIVLTFTLLSNGLRHVDPRFQA